jgi:hypothetical protein
VRRSEDSGALDDEARASLFGALLALAATLTGS